MRVRTLASQLLCLASLIWLVSCTGDIKSPPNAPPVTNGNPFNCPPIDPILGPCNDFHIMHAALTCGGDGKVSSSLSTSHGGATRVRAQFKDGSLLQGSLVHFDPPCNITDGTKADFTFGVVYTGDLGIETDGSGTQCIVQSRLDYTSFRFAFSAMDPNEGMIKDRLHSVMDEKVVKFFFSTGAPSGRCARWRVMPAGEP